jgi:hypothetical protein
MLMIVVMSGYCSIAHSGARMAHRARVMLPAFA